MVTAIARKIGAHRIYQKLCGERKRVAAMHGDLEQSERERIMKAFREGKIIYLVATDVVGRGIDVMDISHIINFDLPMDPENYVHRIGRTGRGFAKGSAISFVAPEEAEKLELIEKFIATKINVLEVNIEEPELTENEVEELDIASMLAEEEARITPKRKKKKPKKR